uniref:L-lactate dehydrogenase complex protein LldF n=1 Tax=Candidatus Kentrum sp. MB TaxID=2138164 RepID=A0A450X2I0_9GAMM|nr:MAG: L-lactate dehydrogenase complex protein LldF [Candidatus Kentron sp. MB]VFK27892.1 MAG: L-lactate dehydrogenase complex protein LldF [Candidatus Kentron sp. MB]VFK74453.1 MAG: L-lactate dehydrogenase complex protein LldF [Candidatus Kentron sp. MB]
MESTTHDFKARATAALLDTDLQLALTRAHGGFVRKRKVAMDAFPEFEALREAAHAIKEHTLSHLDFYLTRFESQVEASGGQVHWARTAEEACESIADICARARGKRIIKGKSMIGEEIGINEALMAAGLEVTETDLGEYIIQLAGETPSHIIAPAVHKTRDEVARLFAEHHAKHGFVGERTEVPALVAEARTVLRSVFLTADVGITGANFLVAETGSSVLVTNEGNGDLSAALPRVHIVLASIEKVLPTLEDATAFLRLLGRSATGQVMSGYTTFFTGPRRRDDRDGPREYHVVLVDNGRAELLASPYREILYCIRCGACLNHCPVYSAVGGHAYGWVYPGPMGAVLTPLLRGRQANAWDLPHACTLNGRCEDVCPVKIPLPMLLRQLRADAYAHKETPREMRIPLAAWGLLARHPWLYGHVAKLGAGMLRKIGLKMTDPRMTDQKRRPWRRLPFLDAWTGTRELPIPPGESFQTQWQRQVERED